MVKDTLRSAGIVVVAEASDGREAVELALHYRPEVVVMDLAMPGRDGIWATRQLHERAPEVRMLLLTISGDTELAVLGLRSGASGYLTKDVDVAQLPAVIHELIDGKPMLAPAVATALIEHLRSTQENGVGMRPVDSPLTTREWEVLDRLCAGATVDDIAAELVLATETVRSHLKNTMRKLGVHSHQEAIEAAAQLRRGTSPLSSNGESSAGFSPRPAGA
jgi:DNA-binding NarL/FixJ family response regulator